MRVIAGTARGIKLKAPKGFTVRPTADRVKEALFNIISPRISGALFLDLYAGSGAIGIEALSRGARFCIFVDHRKDNIMLIKENLAKTKLEQNVRLITADANKTIANLTAENIKADLAYLDPPYNETDILPIVCNIFRQGLITDHGLLIVEHAYKNQHWADCLTGTSQKKYGDTGLTFITPESFSE